MALTNVDTGEILLGSGEVFISKFSDIADVTALTEAEITALTNVGAIDSGATLIIGGEFKEIESDNRGLVKKKKVKTTITFNTGVMSWNIKNLAELLLGATYNDDTTNKIKSMIIGENDNAPELFIRFVHTKDDDTTITVDMYKGVFDGELPLAFSKENPVTVGYNFALLSHNNNYVNVQESYL